MHLSKAHVKTALLSMTLCAPFLNGATSLAGTTIPIDLTTRTCIQGPYPITITAALNYIGEEAATKLRVDCENLPGATGGHSSFSSIEVKDTGMRCPYGQIFEYALKGQCRVP